MSLPQTDLESTKDFRYECAKRIEAQIRMPPMYKDFRLEAVHIAIILLVPMGSLADGGFLASNQGSMHLHDNLNIVASLVRHYFLMLNEDISNPNDYCDQVEKYACAYRNKYRYIVTGESPSWASHIIPFSWNKDEANVCETSLVMGACQAFFTDETCDDLYRLLSNPDDICSSNKQWNVINISESVTAAWSCSSLGLRCLGVGPKASQCPDTQGSIEQEWEVKVQFQWLNRPFKKPNEEMDVIANENDMRNMAEAQIHHERMGCPPFMDAFGIATGHKGCNPILSGHTFTITMSEEDARKYKMMLGLRWFIISIAAMSGAAWYPELLPLPLDW
ncbi:hypothetical protein HYE68_008631 [Fusarium pseudograminearum]|nr:hypothetical protein HYE68_008631 [Fusarium pseudograminearum]